MWQINIDEIKSRDPEFFERNQDFYYRYISDSLLAPARTLKGIPKYKKQYGSIYSPALGDHVAPIDGQPYYAPKGGVRRLTINTNDDWFSYFDDLNGRKSFNIAIHGVLPDPKAAYTTHLAAKKDLLPSEFVEFSDELIGTEDIHHIHLMACLSGNGGAKSIAAQVADLTGKPTTGYRGETMTINTTSAKRIFGDPNDFADLTERLEARPELSIFNHMIKNEADGTWRPTALKKEFSPTFAAPGFDDMASFLEGAFLL